MLILIMVIKRTIITLNSASGAYRMKIFTRSKLLNYSVGSTAIALLLAVSSAQAVLIDTFVATGGPSIDGTPSMTFTSGLFTLTAQAYSTNWGSGVSETVRMTSFDSEGVNAGLGVVGGDDDDDIDNDERLEWIQLSVTGGLGAITGVRLVDFNTTDQVRLIGTNTDGQLSGGSSFPAGPSLFGDSSINPMDFMLDMTGYTYLNVVTGTGKKFENPYDSLRVAGVYVVPEPSVIALFGLGLVGLSFARRRQS
jgi:hypothetical protein